MITVVIGAGIVGLHSARVLREKGHDVYVLDQAGSTSWALSPLDLPQRRLLRMR